MARNNNKFSATNHDDFQSTMETPSDIRFYKSDNNEYLDCLIMRHIFIAIKDGYTNIVILSNDSNLIVRLLPVITEKSFLQVV